MTQIEIGAGSNYGSRYAVYDIVDNVLVLKDEGDHDNLAGNQVASEFGGLTLDEAKIKAIEINREPVGHSYDGCHACNFRVALWLEDKPVELE